MADQKAELVAILESLVFLTRALSNQINNVALQTLNQDSYARFQPVQQEIREKCEEALGAIQRLSAG